jgi:hypothetical protein
MKHTVYLSYRAPEKVQTREAIESGKQTSIVLPPTGCKVNDDLVIEFGDTWIHSLVTCVSPVHCAQSFELVTFCVIGAGGVRNNKVRA